MSYTTIIGYCAAIVSTASFAPQAWKIIKSRETKDISIGMYGLTVFGFSLWLMFGIFEKQWPLVLSNTICLLLSSFILLMKILPQTKKEQVAKALTDPLK